MRWLYREKGNGLVLNILIYFNIGIKSELMIRWQIMGVLVNAIGLKSIAIGSHSFVKKTFSHLGAQAKGRRIIESGMRFKFVRR